MTRTVREGEAAAKREQHAGGKARALGERAHKEGSGKFNWGQLPGADVDGETVRQVLDNADPMFDDEGLRSTQKKTN
ncbi:hypothetical protein BESB_075140 [Besnoitia besnoiti]|uniref:Hyaluronan/mRNA-binding protein domain-containing protein n=1 Tax=Besnoitia besnoiti TaxID=94643 RepID=A0A2A9MG62_BESBE|nr:uncharacterized protein BESB_075140 [Besnoitia besnoiti]PFH34362.1 hypothetical protein BESB_075140 [Besnoitia besnoiti]